MEKTLVVSKKYQDKNGNTKYLFNLFDDEGTCLNHSVEHARKSKKGLILFKHDFIELANNCRVVEVY